MLYGTKFLPDYPQGLLKFGRFRGTRITGDILDNKQDYMDLRNRSAGVLRAGGCCHGNLQRCCDAGIGARTKLGLSRDQVQVLELAQISRSTGELLQPSARTNRTKFRDEVLSPLLATGLLEMTIPDKPPSAQQRYRTTAKGRQVLEEQMRSAGPSASDEIR